MFQKLKLFQSNTFKYSSIFLLFSFLLVNTFDIKSLFIVVLFFAGVIFFVFDFSLKQLLLLTIFFVFSFEKGVRGWELVSVAPGFTNWLYGYAIYYGVSLRSILIFTLFFVSFPELYQYFKKLRKNAKLLFMFGSLTAFVLFAYISTLFSSDYFLSFFGFLRILQAVLLFFSILTITMDTRFKNYLFSSFICIVLINSSIAIFQAVNLAPLGSFLEDISSFGVGGYFTSDGARVFRSAGLLGHPTFFGSYLSMIFLAVLGYLFANISEITGRKIIVPLGLLILFLTISVLGLYTTYVRSSWFVVVFGLLFTLYIFSQRSRYTISFHKLLSIFLIFVGLLLQFISPVRERVLSSLNFLSGGSGEVRIELLQESFKMIQTFPLFGVGPNLFTRMMTQQSLLPENLAGFLFPVHNTFFLFWAELGSLSLLSFLAFVGLTLYITYDVVQKKFEYFGIWLGVIAFILNAQVHALFNQDPSFDMVFLFLGLLVQQWIQHKKLLSR